MKVSPMEEKNVVFPLPLEYVPLIALSYADITVV